MNSLKVLGLARPVYNSLAVRAFASHPLANLLGRLNHVAIAVPDLKKASAFYKNLGAKVSEAVVSAAHLRQ
ncbi:hypothetical protein Y032_0058g2852 [Ancylostoma ceylanicum]|uniref:Glyoxalase/fosfomycin resistance/dioxygenase domain-containing protein n=1 Tax=Ancylostoma ceylanicum TaxID=53326 RepID=A0A016U4E1_9BILA|nr:hypothetical protein Y032_0058g2852 [Ancylostoma ceylanicum]